MCNRLRWLYAAPVAIMFSANASAQGAPALERRLRQLDTLRRDATAALSQAQRSRLEPVDTVSAGSLIVVVRPGDVGLVQPAAGIAWAKLDSLYGDEAARLTGTPLLFYLQGRPLNDVTPAVQRLQHVMAPADATPADVAFQLVRAGSLALRQWTDTALENWLGPMLLPDATPAIEHSHAYTELVTAPSIAVRRCHAGAVDACAAALGIVDGDRVVLWYDATERRAVVRQGQGDVRGMGLRPAIKACLQAQSDAACLEVLHARPWIEPPLSNEARYSLLRVVLAAGGRRAFARLSQSSGRPLGQRLTIAGGLPLDSLVNRWRDQVVAARPQPVTLAAPIGWMALGWSIVFGLLALRSTRWR